MRPSRLDQQKPWPISAPEIGLWIPPTLEDVAGNPHLKEYCRSLILNNGRASNALILGEPGTGKTSTIKTAVGILYCENRPPDSTKPCHHCETCQTLLCHHEESALFAWFKSRESSYFPLDCANITEAKLEEALTTAWGEYWSLFYLDEFYRLARRRMDERLLIPMRALPATWIATSAKLENIEPMVLDRFAEKLHTNPPALDELVEFLARRCWNWMIRVDHASTLIQLARRCNAIVVKAFDLLSKAAMKQNRTLTRQMVDDHPFDFGGP